MQLEVQLETVNPPIISLYILEDALEPILRN